MPSCRFPVRWLLPSRIFTLRLRPPLQPSQWRSSLRAYGTVLEDGRGHDRQNKNESLPIPLNSNKTSAEVDSRNFLLRRSSPDTQNVTGKNGEKPHAETTPLKQQLPMARRERVRLARSTVHPRELLGARVGTSRSRYKHLKTRRQRPSQARSTTRSHEQNETRVGLKRPVTTHVGKPPARRWRKPTLVLFSTSRSVRIRNAVMVQLNRTAELARQGIRWRVKFRSLRGSAPNSTHFSTPWNIAIAKLQRQYDKRVIEEDLQNLELRLDERSEAWARAAMKNIEKGSIPIRSGQTGTIFVRNSDMRQWEYTALWFLRHEPENAVKFLRFSHVLPYPPVDCVSDALDYLSIHFNHCDESTRQEQLSALADLVPVLARRSNGTALCLDSGFFRRLMVCSTDEQIVKMYESIQRDRIFVLWHTFLHFSTYFARNGHFATALEALLAAKSKRAVLGSYAFRTTCATLLRNAIRQPEGLRVCLRIIDNFVKMGVTLDLPMCNITMLNAVEAGDLATAKAIYHSLVEHGLRADHYTHAILLRGCKANIDDAENLNDTIHSAIENTDVLHAPYVATEILHCLALHHTKHNLQNVYKTVVDAYAQLFSLKPLRQLGIQLPELSQPSHPGVEMMQPSLPALGIILSVYLEHTFSQSSSTLPAYEVYQRFRSLVDSKTEPFLSMITQDYIPNAFLTTFIKSRKGLLYAAEVIKDMQRPSPITNVQRCRPSVQSWSIFLRGFTRHNEVKMADQILSYMQRQGIKPNEVTWNTLTAGYAAVQDLEGVLDTLRRMENDQVTWDRWTFSAIKRLRDRERLQAEWQKRQQPLSLDFTAELKQGLDARISAVDGTSGELYDTPGTQTESGSVVHRGYRPFGNPVGVELVKPDPVSTVPMGKDEDGVDTPARVRSLKDRSASQRESTTPVEELATSAPLQAENTTASFDSTDALGELQRLASSTSESRRKNKVSGLPVNW